MKKWENLIKPINDLCSVLINKESNMRDTVKSATALVTGFYAHAKLIGGLKSFCKGALESAYAFRRAYSSSAPQEYLGTTEGIIFDVTRQSLQKHADGARVIDNELLKNIRTGSALKKDFCHAFPDMVDNYADCGNVFSIVGNDGIKRILYQVEGSLNKMDGIFEWILDPCVNRGVTHRLFIPKGTITGKPNMQIRK